MDMGKKSDPAAGERARVAEEERVKSLQDELQSLSAARIRKYGSTPTIRRPGAPATGSSGFGAFSSGGGMSWQQ